MKFTSKKILSLGMAAAMLSATAAVPAQAVAADESYEAASSASVVSVGKKISVKVASKGKTAVRLKWSKYSKATGYKVYMKTSKGWKCKKVVKGKNNLNYKITGLKPGTKYYFYVQPYTKKNGKTTYGAKVKVSTTTKYGAAGGNYGGKYLTLKYNTKQWEADGDSESLSLVYKGRDAGADSILMSATAAKLNAQEKKMSLDEIAEEIVREFADMGIPAQFTGHSKLFGLKSAEINIAVDEDAVMKYSLAKKGSKLYAVLRMYEKDQETLAKKRINAVLKTYKLK